MHLQISQVHIARAEAEMERESRFFECSMRWLKMEKSTLSIVCSTIQNIGIGRRNNSEIKCRSGNASTPLNTAPKCSFFPRKRVRIEQSC